MIDMPTDDEPVTVVEGDALESLRAMPSGCADAVICDPPYPCIKRSYGYWTETEWFSLMDPVVEECRRVLKPSGSAVFVLQPNSERVGRMRPWLWEFMAKWTRDWGMVQDAYWWNTCALPLAGSNTGGLMRPAAKPCVWLGLADCYRDQVSVLMAESPHAVVLRRADVARSHRNAVSAAGVVVDSSRARGAAQRRGGVTPFNVLAMGAENRKGNSGHSAPTPLALCKWWVRYICPPGGLVIDPFGGSGTVGLAAIAEGRRCVLVERIPEYAAICRKRVADAVAARPADLFAGAT